MSEWTSHVRERLEHQRSLPRPGQQIPHRCLVLIQPGTGERHQGSDVITHRHGLRTAIPVRQHGSLGVYVRKHRVHPRWIGLRGRLPEAAGSFPPIMNQTHQAHRGPRMPPCGFRRPHPEPGMAIPVSTHDGAVRKQPELATVALRARQMPAGHGSHLRQRQRLRQPVPLRCQMPRQHHQRIERGTQAVTLLAEPLREPHRGNDRRLAGCALTAHGEILPQRH